MPSGSASVLCSAYVASLTGGMTGKLVLTVIGKSVKSISQFNIPSAYSWQTVANALDLDGGANVLVEFSMDSGQGHQLCIDFVSLS